MRDFFRMFDTRRNTYAKTQTKLIPLTQTLYIAFFYFVAFHFQQKMKTERSIWIIKSIHQYQINRVISVKMRKYALRKIKGIIKVWKLLKKNIHFDICRQLPAKFSLGLSYYYVKLSDRTEWLDSKRWAIVEIGARSLWRVLKSPTTLCVLSL